MQRAIIPLVFLWLMVLCAMETSPTKKQHLRPPHYLERCVNGHKQVEDCFKDLPSHLMEFLQNTKLVIGQQEIFAQCDVFNQCLKCFDDYSARCLQNQELSLFKKDINGVIKFFEKFCADKNFQRDYLRYKNCFANKKDDWISCTSDIEKALTEDLNDNKGNASNKLMQFCCDYLAHESCIYNDTRYMSYTNSSKFVCKVAKMLSPEDYFGNCPQLEDTCACAAQICSIWSSVVLTALVLVLHYGRYHVKQ